MKIIIATHKAYPMPSDPLYLPVHAGAAVSGAVLPYQRDDEGENISALNKNYCELTALYWAWKNLDEDYLGLCHYRRYYGRKGQPLPVRAVLKQKAAADEASLEPLLKEYPVILAAPRNYYIETNYSQYAHAHHARDLDETRMIIAEKYPRYLRAFDRVMKSTKGHRFNMFIMRRDLFNAYCAWLFDVLQLLRERLDITDYDDYDARVFGFVSERLLDVWIRKNRVAFTELPVINTESQHWGSKILNFLKRKVRGRRT